MTLCTENPKQKLELMREFSKAAEYKNQHTKIYLEIFLNINNKDKMSKRIPFKIA